jgi:nucleotide-binding universal stress UspA family protein
MYRKILVPLDGTSFGEHALPLAMSIASRAGAELQLVHVHEPVGSVFGGGELAANMEFDARLRNQERGYLERIVDRVARSCSAAVSPLLLEGPIADSLAGRAAKEADLVVMTTHGRGPLGRMWLGSVADQLIRCCTLPLVLVRPEGGKVDFTREVLLQNIMIPLDGTDLAEQILEPAIALGRVMHANYTLLRIIKPATVGNYADDIASMDEFNRSLLRQVRQLFDRANREAEDYLYSVAERMGQRSLCVRTRVVSSDQVPGRILQEARTEPADLIALETHGLSGLKRLLKGSVADKVLRGGSTPLLVHRLPVLQAREESPEEIGCPA